MGENWLYNLTDKPGVKVFRIDNKSQQLSKEQFSLTATLKSDDSYVVLNATLDINGGPNTYKVYSWIGNTTTQEEFCNEKIQDLKNALLPCECPTQKETQGNESKEFKAFFRGGLKYIEPLVLKTQTNVRDESFVNRLYQLKGRRVPVVFLVELTAKSLNSGDVFILDTHSKIFQWNGNGASRMEKGKALDMTTRLRDERMNVVKAEIIVIREDHEPEEFWTLLGGKVPVMSEKEGRDDDDIEEQALTLIKLYKLNEDDKGQITTELFDRAGKHLDRSNLLPENSYLLDTGNAVFVWNGRTTNVKKESAVEFANNYMKINNKPSYSSLSFVAMGVEPCLFRTHFTGKFTEYIDTPEAFDERTKKKFSKVAGSLRQEKVNVDALLHPEKYQIAKEEFAEYIPSAAAVHEKVLHQEFKIFLVQDKKRVDLPQEEYGIFYSGQCYIVQYTVRRDGGTRKFVVYYWQGRDCNREDKGSSGLLATDLSSKFGRGCTMVRTIQNKEPIHFLSHFRGYMVIRKGRRDEWAAKYENKTMLFQLRGTNELDATAIQVDAQAFSLNSNDSFVLQCSEAIFIWNGKGANEHERKNAQLLSGRVTELQSTSKTLEVITLEEEQESENFWKALGGKAAYSSDKALKEGNIKARLFQCNNKTGMFRVFEIFDFTQDDLDDDDIMLLDTYNEIFVWFGSVAKKKESVVEQSIEVAMEYMKLADDGRDNDGPIYQVDAGQEPIQFISYFKGWSESRAISGEDMYQRNLELLRKQDGVTLVDLAESNKPRRPRVVSTTSPLPNKIEGSSSGNPSPLSMSSSGSGEKWHQYNPNGECFDYDRLKAKPCPEGVDGGHLEAFLSDEQFVTYLKMTREAFYKLPNWHQLRVKKTVGLF